MWAARTLAIAIAVCAACSKASVDPASDGGAGDPDATPRPGRPDAGEPADCPDSITEGITALGPALGGATSALLPAIAVTADDAPVVAWVESSNIVVMQWTGSEWSPLGAPIAPSGGATDQTTPVIAAGSDIVVVWAAMIGVQWHPFAARWTGTTWQPLGGAIDDGEILAFQMSLLIDYAGAPTLAWSEYNGATTNVQVARYNGSDWEPVGTPQSAAGGMTDAYSPSLAIDSTGALVLAWAENDDGSATATIRVRRHSGADWVSFGGGDLDALPGTTSAFSPRVAIDGSDRVAIAWSEANNPTAVHVARYSGSSWDALGTALGAASGPTNSFATGLVVDSTGRPTAIWGEPSTDINGTYQVHAYRHGGAMFDPLAGGLLDAIAGDTDGDSSVAAIDRCDRIYVAWHETAGAVLDVYVRQVYVP